MIHKLPATCPENFGEKSEVENPTIYFAAYIGNERS